MDLTILQDPTRKQIIDLINKGNGKFNDIRKEIKIDSNKLTYHLKKLVACGFIILENERYNLSSECKNTFPYRKIVTLKQMPVMPVTAVAIIQKGKVLLQVKPNEPNRGTLILFGGTVKFGDSIESSARNEVLKQAGVKLDHIKLRAISESMVTIGKSIKQHWIVNLYTATTSQTPSNGKWYSLNKLPKNLFLDNKFFLERAIYNDRPKLYRITKNTKEIHIEQL